MVMEDDETEVRLERQRQREMRNMETAEQREERLKIIWERQVERTGMKTAEYSSILISLIGLPHNDYHSLVISKI